MVAASPSDDAGEPLPDILRLDLLATIYADGGTDLEAYLRRFPGYEQRLQSEYQRIRELAEPARTIGPYRVLRELARGGQAVVFEAEDPRLRRRAALKVLRRSAALTPDALARFAREAELSARLCDPGLCAVYDTGSDDGCSWIAMQLVPGPTLAERLRQQTDGEAAPTPASIRSAVEMAVPLLRTLHRLHEHGIVHRDLKPSNVAFDATGRPVVLDLGLARALDHAEGPTRTGDTVGTPAFMAPEQVRGDAIDRRTDLHAVGAMLYQAIALRHPFAAGLVDSGREALYRAILTHEPPAPPGADADLAAVLAMALAKEPAERYPTAAEFADDLLRWLSGIPVRARRAGPLRRTWRWARREKVAAAGLLAALLALSAGLAVATWLLLRLSDQQRQTQQSLVRTSVLALQAEAARVRPLDPTLALLLAERAYELAPEPESLSLLYATWRQHPERAVLPAAGSEVLRCELAPDRRSVLIGSGDGTLRWWHLADGSVHTLTCTGESISAAAFAPDAATVAAASGGTVFLWRTDGTLQRRVPLGEGVLTMAIAGERVLAGCASGRVFAIAAGGEPQPFASLAGPALQLFAVPHHDLLLAVDAGRNARLLRPDGTEVRHWRVPVELPPHAASTPDGRILATFVTPARTGAPQATCQVVQLLDCELGSSREVGIGMDLDWFDLSADGTRLLVLTAQGIACSVQLDGDHRAVPYASNGITTAVAQRADGTVAGSDLDGSLWAVLPERRSVRSHCGTGGVCRLAFDAWDRLLAVDRDGSAQAWSLRDTSELPPQGRQGCCGRAHFGPRGELAAVVHDGIAISRADGDRLLPLPAPHAAVSAAWSPDGARLLLVRIDHGLSICERNGKLLADLAEAAPFAIAAWLGSERVVALQADRAAIYTAGGELAGALLAAARPTAVATSPDGRLFAMGDEIGNVRVGDREGTALWQVATGTSVSSLDLAADGRVAAADREGFLTCWADGRQLGRVQSNRGAVESVAFSPDGQRLLVAGHDGEAAVYGRTGIELARVLPAAGPLLRASFAPAGGRFLTLSRTGHVDLWSADGALAAHLAAGEQQVLDMSLSPDGEHLALSGNGRSVAVLPLRPERLVERVRQTCGRTFTPAERDRHALLLGGGR